MDVSGSVQKQKVLLSRCGVLVCQEREDQIAFNPLSLDRDVVRELLVLKNFALLRLVAFQVSVCDGLLLIHIGGAEECKAGAKNRRYERKRLESCSQIDFAR